MKTYARDCSISELDEKTASIFVEENHTQGNAKAILYYGLFYRDKLVQVLSLGKPRFNKNYHWELIRDCTKKNYEIIGGISKLWKHFIDNNTVHSCICYSYPHDGEYTSKYVDYCGFINISKAKPTKKIYFEGIWNGELKRIDKSILERQGADRLLRGSFGQERTNEQILIDLGFKKKEEDGYTPQVDSYFPEGIVYRITDLDTGKFYIGETFKKQEFLDGNYNGSGNKWIEYYNKYKDIHRFKREILKDDFTTPKKMFDYEVNEIRKYCKELNNGNYQVDYSTGCMNEKTCSQCILPVCPECGGWMFIHKKSCSRYAAPIPCEECGGVRIHRKICSKYKRKVCEECGSVGTHRKYCSKYKEPRSCLECGKQRGHLKSCSFYKKPKPCSECGRAYGPHKKSCSHYKSNNRCEICRTTNGHHKVACPNFNKNFLCAECGVAYTHKKTCSRYVKPKGRCEFCSTPPGGKHRKDCPNFKNAKNSCPHCKTPPGGRHKKECPNFKPIICPECNGKSGRHKMNCSKYKSKKV